MIGFNKNIMYLITVTNIWTVNYADLPKVWLGAEIRTTLKLKECSLFMAWGRVGEII